MSAPVPKRLLVPIATPPENRPRATPEPCAACGADVDPLRAANVLAFEDGLRFLCNDRCVQDFRSGTRSRRRMNTPAAGTPAGTARTPAGGTPRYRTPFSGFPAAILEPPSGAIATVAGPSDAPSATRWLGAGGVAVGIAVVAGLFPRPELALVSTAASTLAALIALRLSVRCAREIGLVSWLVGPIGTIGAALSAYSAAISGNGGSFGLCAAALAAVAMLTRAYFDGETRQPIERAVADLLARLPRKVYVPVKEAGDPLAIATTRVEVAKVRTGEEVIAMKGHVLAVDGMVQAGEASVLPYPGATTTVRRKTGDALLAGATVTEGAVRVLATRVGDDRALVRVARFGTASERDSAPLVRLAAEVTRYGGLAVMALALAAVALAGSRGLSSPLAVASAVLIAAPLLAVRRGTDWTFVAGAASAG
ncbi:MAG TPA: hypothetical protein VHM19_10780, partial [Polyangiales bacterium]|nr:hypothetical protein [Polyangiales bacterium]